MIIGSSYHAMNFVILNKYGIHLPKPEYAQYSLEVAKVGVHYNYISYLSCVKYEAFAKDCRKEYPQHKYDLDIVIILTKKHFMSRNLKDYLARERNVTFYLEEDIILLKASKLEDLSEEYFKEDLTDLPIDVDEVKDKNEAITETAPLIDYQGEVNEVASVIKNLQN